jgi:hypothetical protein
MSQADEPTPAAEPTKPARARRGTVSIPGRGAAAAVVDAPSVVDDLRSQPIVPATTAGAAPVAPLASSRSRPVPAAERAAEPAGNTPPPPPPRKQAPARVQFSTKLPPHLITNVKDFSDHYQAEIQMVVELALQEYMTSRGWEIRS